MFGCACEERNHSAIKGIMGPLDYPPFSLAVASNVYTPSSSILDVYPPTEKSER